MRRCAVFVGFHKEAELGFDFLVRELEGAEHLLLQLGVGDTHGAAGKLDAVEREVERLRDDLGRVSVEILDALLLGHGERVVHREPLARLLVLLEEREIHDPEEAELVGDDIQALRDFQTKCAEGGENGAVLVGDDQNYVALFRAETFINSVQLVLGHKFLEGGVRLVDPSDIGEALCADALDILGELVDLLSGIDRSGVLRDDRADGAAVCDRAGEHAEAAVLY